MAVYTAIDDSEAYFQTQLYTGTGSEQSITLGGDTDMQPDFLWFKLRSTGGAHAVFDSVRGTTGSVYRRLFPYSDGLEDTPDALTAINSDGFTVGSDGNINGSSQTMVAWCWKETADSGFDIVSYTGTGSAKTESHSLSAVPHFIIVKNRTDDDNWRIYHHKNTAAPETDYLVLDTTAATADDSTAWNDTAPTSSVFSVGTSDETNENTDSFIAYLFSDKQGFSKFGSYEGNGNADGTFVYTGFRPAFVMTKSIDSTSSWEIFDNKREGYNVDNDALVVDDPIVEATADQIDLLSNGFKCRIATDPNVAETYIYMAFAEAPFVNSNGVPCNAR